MRAASLLFPGQGAQVPGMGRDVADASSEAMDMWKKAEAISGLPLREIYWEGDEAAMSDTMALQPALTVVNLTLWQALSRSVRPLACAGHSLGEYSALAVARVLDVETCLKLVSLRGRLMAESDPDGLGAMAAIVKLPLEKVQEIVEKAKAESGEVLLVANYNTPGQYVISGTKDAVALASSMAKEVKGRALPLAVSGAFHSPLMQKAADELGHHMKKVVWARPICPVYSNVTAGPLEDGESIREAMLVQMTSPVRWIEIMQSEAAHGLHDFIEVGPKAVLSKMVARCLEGVETAGPVTTAVVSKLEEATA